MGADGPAIICLVFHVRDYKDTIKRAKLQKREEKTKNITKDACKPAYKSISCFAIALWQSVAIATFYLLF